VARASSTLALRVPASKIGCAIAAPSDQK